MIDLYDAIESTNIRTKNDEIIFTDRCCFYICQKSLTSAFSNNTFTLIGTDYIKDNVDSKYYSELASFANKEHCIVNFDFLENIYLEQLEQEKQNEIECEKQQIYSTLKSEIKSKLNKKFVIGETLILRSKIKGFKKTSEKRFIVKKFIYKILDNEVKLLILKRITPIKDNSNIYTLNREDCKRLHIKFEPGLEVWPMELNWIKKKK